MDMPIFVRILLTLLTFCFVLEAWQKRKESKVWIFWTVLAVLYVIAWLKMLFMVAF